MNPFLLFLWIITHHITPLCAQSTTPYVSPLGSSEAAELRHKKTRLAMRSVNPLRWVTIPCGRREAATGFGRDLHLYFGGCLKPPWEPQCEKIIYGKFILYGGNPVNPARKKHFETHYFWYTHTVHLWCENKRQINNNGIEVFQTRKMRCFPRRVAIFRWQQSLWPSPSTRGLLSQELLGAIGQCLSRGAQFLKGDFVFLEPTIFQGRSVKTSGV